jgi:hypothetical protein
MIAKETVAALQLKLRTFAGTLSDREQQMLKALLYCAADPLDRMLLKTPFTEEEKAILARLEK